LIDKFTKAASDVADSDRLDRSAHRCARAMHLVGWPVVPAGSETDEKVSPQLKMATLPRLRGFRAVPADPVLRMLWNGLNHQHSSLEAALQVAAAIEIKRAGRFLVVMDTLVTLAPLLGLLGTITGLIKSSVFWATRNSLCKPSLAVLPKR